MRILTFILICLIILFGISFAALNAIPVQFNYYLGERTLPLSLLLVFVFVLGCILGSFIGFCFFIKMKMQNYRLKQRLTIADKEIENLRAIPLREKI